MATENHPPKGCERKEDGDDEVERIRQAGRTGSQRVGKRLAILLAREALRAAFGEVLGDVVDGMEDAG